MRDRKDLAEGLPVGPISADRIDELEKGNAILKEKLDAHCMRLEEEMAKNHKLECWGHEEKNRREESERELMIAQAQLRVVNLIFGGKNDSYI